MERLGAGGMSVVWFGFDQILGRRVAIKMLNPRLAADPAFRRRLRLEARSAARLNHPNITDVYDYGESDTSDGGPVPFVVMELVDGQTLASRLANGRSMPVRHAALVCAQVGAALDAAHQRGIVHRDVTPGNVMLTSAGAKILDFGISALIGEAADSDGSILGTPAYLAPERLAGPPATPATDVYGLGLTFYRAVAGRLPFAAVETKTEMLRAHLYRSPDLLPTLDGLPGSLAALCLRSLAKDPAHRPTIREFTRACAAVAGIPMPPTLATPAPVAADDRSVDATTATTLLPSWQATQAVREAGSPTPATTLTRGPGRNSRRVSALVAAAAVTAGAAWAGIGGPWGPRRGPGVRRLHRAR